MGGLSPVQQRPLIPFASSGIQAPQSSPPNPAPAPSPTPPPARALAMPLSSPTPICPVSLNTLHGSIGLGPVLGSRTCVTCEARPVSPAPHGGPLQVRQQVPVHLR